MTVASVLSCFCSSKAEFLERLAELAPDLCVTAAYGNILPQRFLDIPRFGTLNVHPSLLPAYRGAAPVQRALQVLSAHSVLVVRMQPVCGGRQASHAMSQPRMR